ncbi:MAG: hypothetical protein JXR73_22090 [Candidatus Omnitrophica bacterium]|nr:hypothetical protein [Candidatus Omnitrophota bacterium]
MATKRWHLWGFIPCSAGLWPLGLYLWNKKIDRRTFRIVSRILSYGCFFAGSVLFIAGLWRLAGILIAIRVLIWIDQAANLSAPLVESNQLEISRLFNHPFDKASLLYIGLIFLVFAVSKERLIEFTDPSDHFYHMAVAQKILERGSIPLWDDWEFAPEGRPHLYPPLLHLLIAFFAGAPDRVLIGFSNIQMLLYPSALFAYWLLFRTWLRPSHAYLSLLILSMEFMFTMGCLIGLPASLVNAMWPFILLALTKKKNYAAMLLLAAAFYTHTGMPILISLALLVFGVWKRQFFLSSVFVVMGACILSIPWTLRYYVFADWMHSGGAPGYSVSSIVARLLWLQIINPLFIILAVWGFFRLKEAAVFKSQALGFLPMLIQYGGRFFMHGAPFLSPFIAVHFLRFLEGSITRRRAAAFALMTLIPLPCINFIGPGDQVKISLFPGITASHLCVFYVLNRQPKDQSDLENLVDALRNTTSPDDILHLPDEGMYHFADYLTVMTGRRTDMGGWGEVSKPEMWEAIQKSRNDPNDGVFVSKKRENIPDSRCIEEIGSFFIGRPPAEEVDPETN